MRGGLGGLRAWVLQRATALYLTAYLLFVGLRLMLSPPADAEAWRVWLTAPGMAVATAIFFLALLAHAWVGARDIAIDYVRPVGVRLAVLALVAVALLAQGLWVLRVLLGGGA